MTEYRSPSGRYVDWRALLADAARAGGRWLTAFRDSPTSLVRDIRQRRPAPLAARTDGRLVAQARNTYENENTGTEYGDIYVRWTTEPEEERPMPKTRHDVDVPDVTAAELEALGRMMGLPTRTGTSSTRSPAAAVVLEEYGRGTPREAIAITPVRFAIYTDDEVWERAMARASVEGISIPAVLAEFAPRLLERERRIQAEGAGL